MKTLLLVFAVCFVAPAMISSQTTFTKVTTGPVVNDGGISFGGMWADYDNDNKVDLFVANMASAPGQRNFLYHNEGNGVFIKIITGNIVTDSGKSFGGSWGDYDNDGRIDLYVANYNNQNEFLYHNDGAGIFTKISTGIIVTEGGNSNSCGWIDVNNDGKLDMCVTNYGQRRFLYTNNGDGTFTKITAGAFVNDVSPSISSNWGDYNNDGRADVFVANAGQITWPNFFYRNDGGNNLTKITDLNVSIDTGKSFSGSWGDFNNDGYLDLYVANDEFRNSYLYKNNGDATFTRILHGPVATEGFYSACGTWADFNNDGWLDLFISRWQNQNNYLYFNNGDGTFSKVTTGNIVNDAGNSFGCSTADYDNDGDLDLFVANINNENNFLYRNNATNENTNKWISIKCVGTISNRSAIGARVYVRANINGTPVGQIREVSSQMGYNSQNDARSHFGLGGASVIDTIKVTWPSGSVNTFTNINPNQFVTITENQGMTEITEKKTELASAFKLYQNYPNPFNPATKINYELRVTNYVKLSVYNSAGRQVAALVNKRQAAGSYVSEFDGSNLASGVYFYKLQAGDFSETKKMVLIR